MHLIKCFETECDPTFINTIRTFKQPTSTNQQIVNYTTNNIVIVSFVIEICLVILFLANCLSQRHHPIMQRQEEIYESAEKLIIR